MIGCKCDVCISSSPYNKRLRPSGLIRLAGKTLLIDVGPDFRQQALKYKIDHLDALLLTHTHYDHIAGVDELRVFYFKEKKALPCLLSEETLEDLKRRYHYLFQPIGEAATVSAQLEFHLLEEDIGEREFLGVKIGYASYFQGDMKVTGFRIGDLAYISDIRDFDDSIFVALKGIKTLVLSALMEGPSRVHLSFQEAISFAKKAGVHKTWLTHMTHTVDYEAASKNLPPDVKLGYDGLELEFLI